MTKTKRINYGLASFLKAICTVLAIVDWKDQAIFRRFSFSQTDAYSK